MEDPNQASRKRAFSEPGSSNKPPPPKRVRFPKGKKGKSGDVVYDEEAKPVAAREPRLAAKERVMRRIQITAELLDEENTEILDDITRAEFHGYEDDETFIDGDIQLEPFNLSREREEGFFDPEGNYVEFMKENEIKDAWLDSVELQQQFSGKHIATLTDLHEDYEIPDLSSEEIAKTKRRIANVLEPGETVLKALKRLRGTSNNRKDRMPAETKQVFDQLTEDAVKLLNDGDFDVYDEKQENFQREAEGYEKLAQARGQITSANEGAGSYEAANGGDVDMFAEDDASTLNPPSEALDNHNVENTVGGGDSETDYIYEETSGYYYSSSSGYYYDPSSGLYGSEATGQWYSYNDGLGTYEEVQQVN